MKRINSHIGSDDWLHEEWEHDGNKYYTMIPPRISGSNESPQKEWDGQASLKMAKKMAHYEDSPSENKCSDGTKIPEGGCFGCEEGSLCR